jgi:RNA polymerase sigma-70 factor (ECF subfamily)
LARVNAARDQHDAIAGQVDTPEAPGGRSQAGIDEAEAPPPDVPAAADGDRALVARMLAGDEAAFAGLVQAMHGHLLRFVQSLLGRAEGAEDVVQETWLAALSNLRQWQGRASLKTWIYAIAVNRARKETARRGRVLAFSSLQATEDDPSADPAADGRAPWSSTADPPSPLASLHDREVVEELERAVTALPPAQRAVIILCDIEQLDGDSVCNVLGLSRTNRRVLLHRARSRVREALRARFGTI